MIEEMFPQRSMFEETLADGCVPTFGYGWGDGDDDPQIGVTVGWCDRSKKHQPYLCIDLFWRKLQVGWLFS